MLLIRAVGILGCSAEDGWSCVGRGRGTKLFRAKHKFSEVLLSGRILTNCFQTIVLRPETSRRGGRRWPVSLVVRTSFLPPFLCSSDHLFIIFLMRCLEGRNSVW